jgi:hypothetical protein
LDIELCHDRQKVLLIGVHAMSISDTLNYPFRNNNMLKILPIALAYGIILYLMNFGTIERNTAVICGASFAVLVFSMVISGYYISALRRLQAGDENLPDVDFGKNVKDGVLVVLAGLLYFLPVIILVFVAFMLTGGMNLNSSDAAGGSILLLCGAMIGAIILGIVLSAAMQVGIVRFAAEESSSALFDVTGNWSIATSNFGTVLGLWGRTFIIGLIGGIVSGIVTTILNTMFPGQTRPFFEPTLMFWLVSALLNVAAYTISLFIVLAQYHLIYRFGVELGIGTGEKSKNEPYNFEA